MKSNNFSTVAMCEENQKWRDAIRRQKKIYSRRNDIRSNFARDFNRILHSTAYRRLKHKTQIFFATENDHICTRIEHVNHVAAVSYTISKYLGLNTELAQAIAIGHDLGHTPFGHEGEDILKRISERDLGERFWHEKNSLWFVDKIETLKDPDGNEMNLNLTYAVRDGIVSHCGEDNENAILPRKKVIDLQEIAKPNQYGPYTWEACIVKVADKISFLGRDIEDALTLRFVTDKQIRNLINRINKKFKMNVKKINTTVLMHDLIIDLCNSSSPKEGIRFSEKNLRLLKELREFSKKNIYYHPKLDHFKRYAEIIIESIYKTLSDSYKGRQSLSNLTMEYKKTCSLLADTFSDWLIKYSDLDAKKRKELKFQNAIIYRVEEKKSYLRAIVDYISGMTDSFAIKVFTELTSFLK